MKITVIVVSIILRYLTLSSVAKLISCTVVFFYISNVALINNAICFLVIQKKVRSYMHINIGGVVYSFTDSTFYSFTPNN